MHFSCYGNLMFPLAYNGKSENWDFLLSHCRYYDKSFTEMFVEWSSTKPIILVKTSIWLVSMASEMLNLRKKYLKNQLLRSYKRYKAEFADLFIILASVRSSFYCRCLSTLVVMATVSVHMLVMGKWKLAFLAISLEIFWWKCCFFFINVYWDVPIKHKDVVHIPYFDVLPWHLKVWNVELSFCSCSLRWALWPMGLWFKY